MRTTDGAHAARNNSALLVAVTSRSSNGQMTTEGDPPRQLALLLPQPAAAVRVAARGRGATVVGAVAGGSLRSRQRSDGAAGRLVAVVAGVAEEEEEEEEGVDGLRALTAAARSAHALVEQRAVSTRCPRAKAEAAAAAAAGR